MCVLTCERDGATNVLLPVLAKVSAAERDPALLRVEEAKQEIGDRRLSRSALADQGEPRAGLEAEAESVEREGFVRAVPRPDAFERDREARRGGGRLGRIVDGRPPVHQLEDAPTGGERRREVARRLRERLDALEGGEREQG